MPYNAILEVFDSETLPRLAKSYRALEVPCIQC